MALGLPGPLDPHTRVMPSYSRRPDGALASGVFLYREL
jgi:hypothetical protein